VFIWFSLFADRAALERHASAFTDLIREKQIAGKLSRLIKEKPEILLLAPTARSPLGARGGRQELLINLRRGFGADWFSTVNLRQGGEAYDQ
jgi:hypothetical protein